MVNCVTNEVPVVGITVRIPPEGGKLMVRLIAPVRLSFVAGSYADISIPIVSEMVRLVKLSQILIFT